MKRIFYNSDNKKIYIFTSSHSIYLHNHKDILNKGFDYYIRGLIEDNTLYLRLFYPYEDIDTKTYTFIKQASYEALKRSEADIIKELKKNDIVIKEIFLNVDNEQLKNKLKLQYV